VEVEVLWPGDEMDRAGPKVTVVVPTRDEASNVRELIRRLEHALAGQAEIVFVDDSRDETPDVIREACSSTTLPIRLIHRDPEHRHDGLSGAVVEGLRVAHARQVCVIDADLQHPPELLPRLLQRAGEDDLDVVVASRRCEGGKMATLGMLRRVLSGASTFAARALFPIRLRAVSDPMSGFFVVRRDAVRLEHLRPRGFKILLELLVRNPGLRVGEVPFEFGARFAGDSKASALEGLRYLRQLASLRLGDTRGWRLTPHRHRGTTRPASASRSASGIGQEHAPHGPTG
jgi:dolichol-phosphate mannosyltransferase